MEPIIRPFTNSDYREALTIMKAAVPEIPISEKQLRDQQLADRRAKSEQKAAEKRAQTEREISLDNQHEAALQGYIDNTSALLLESDLSNPVELDKVRKIARVRTLTVLPRCDGRRKALALQFLCESDLINKDSKVVDLERADFSGAELFNAQLSKADLSRANLSHADLSFANLDGADLRGVNLDGTVLHKANLNHANLSGVDLSDVDLHKANLSHANLSEANLRGADLRANLSGTLPFGPTVTTEQLEKAASLKGATMPDGSIHP